MVCLCGRGRVRNRPSGGPGVLQSWAQTGAAPCVSPVVTVPTARLITDQRTTPVHRPPRPLTVHWRSTPTLGMCGGRETGGRVIARDAALPCSQMQTGKVRRVERGCSIPSREHWVETLARWGRPQHEAPADGRRRPRRRALFLQQWR